MPVVAHAQPKKPDPVAAFLQQDKYTYCDAKILSALWKVSMQDAKAGIGRKLGDEKYLTAQPTNARKARVGAKLQASATKYLDDELAKARANPKATCTYVDAGLSFNDVEKLAKLWKMSVGKAKAFISQKATANGTAFIKEALGGPGTQKDKDLTAFLNQSKYTYCDAAMIAAMWNQSVEEGKTLIGLKINTKGTDALDKIIADAREAAKKKPSVAGCK